MNEKLIKQNAVREMCGGISDMTLWRWRQERLIPQPVNVRGVNYWRQSEIQQWIADGCPALQAAE